MRKRILSIVLVLALCLAYMPVKVHAVDYEVANSTELEDALDALADGDTIILTQDIEYGFEIGGIGGNYTLDLNGHILTLNNSFESPASWTITDSSGTNSGIFEVELDFFLTTATSTLTISDGAGLEVNGVFSLAGPSITMSGPNSLIWNGAVSLPDNVNLNFGDSDFSIEISNIANVETSGNLDDLATVLQNYVKDRYNIIAGTNLTIEDRTGAGAPMALTLKNWPLPTIDISFLNSTYNGQEQELIVVGDYDTSAVEGIRYGDISSVMGTTSGTQINAGDYTDLAYLVLGTDDYDDIYATGDAHINPADMAISITGNTGKYQYNTYPQSVEGFVASSDHPSFDSYNVIYTGGYSSTGTDVGTYPMNLDIGLFEYDDDNFNASFSLAQDGQLIIANLPQAEFTTPPEPILNLTYNGEAQQLTSPGAYQGGTAVYSVDEGSTWSEDLPAGTIPGDYHVYYKVLGDDGHTDSDYDYIQVTIGKAPAVEVIAVDKTIQVNQAVPAMYELQGGDLYDSYTVSVEWLESVPMTDPPDTSVAGDYHFEIMNVEFETPGDADYYESYPSVGAPNSGTLTVVAASSGGGGGGGSTTPEESYDFTQPSEGVGAGKMDDENWPWGDRANLSKDAATLYMVLSNNSVSEEEDNPLPYPGLGTEHFLASDDTWVLPAEDPAIEAAEVIDVRVCQDNEPIYLANGDGKVDQSTFGNSDFFTVGVGTGDTKIDYANLKTGDVVSNTSFNGVFVTKLQKSNNPTFDADLTRLKSETIASFRAFELDHPEVFWLNGSIKLRVLTVTLGSEQTSFIFMTLVDDKGFTMRIAEYAAAGSIEAGIKQRDAAVAAIIAQIPAGASDREKVTNLNKWFTLNNEYNRSADLSSIGFTPHRSLKSLTGNFGINGPVCDGYSRGFKTVCDRLGIPVVLETGTASIGSHSELHMWMSVKVDGTWYGMDTTWNDPIVKGKDGKVSGYENEKYLLVGNDTVVDGAKFGVSHPANKTPGGTTGVLFATLILNPNEIYGYTAIDYDDVKSTDWFFDYVQDVSARGLMNGTSTNLFSPQGTATRGQIVQILYNIAGQPEVEAVKVEGWFGVPATWAMDKGIVAGYPDGDFHGNDPVTREQLATILWAFEGAPEQSGELSFADADKVSSYAVNAMLWAKKEGLIGGKPGNLADPQGTATRAEIATIFSNYMK